MKCNVLAICDDQIVYSEFLIKQLLRVDEEVFHICKFSSFAQLKEFNKEHEIQSVLLSECYEEEARTIKAKNYFILTEEKVKARIKVGDEDGRRGIVYIFRYQSVELIYEKLLEGIESQQVGDGEFEKEEVRAKLIGIYNPVHRNGQTTFARSLARYYGTSGRRVLYLNMEEYAGITEKDIGSEGDLGEVLYYLKQDIKSINFRLAAFTRKGDGYEFVQPMLISRELCAVTKEEWIAFLEEITARSGYDIIILDLDSCIDGLLDILERCDIFYMPVRKDCKGHRKREQFEVNLMRLNRENICNMIVYKYLEVVESQDAKEIKQQVYQQVAAMF